MYGDYNKAVLSYRLRHERRMKRMDDKVRMRANTPGWSFVIRLSFLWTSSGVDEWPRRGRLF